MRGVMITQTEGRSSQYLEFYHPDGIREIACATFGSYEISKVTSRKDFLCLGEHEFHRTEGRASQ